MAVAEQFLVESTKSRPYGFQKGVSGNPAGNSIYRHPNLLLALKNKLNAEADIKRKRGEVVSPMLVRDQIINELLRLALKSDDDRVRFAACKEIFDRVEGKAPQNITVTPPTDKRLQYLACLQFVKDRMIQAGSEVPPDSVLIEGIAQTSGYEDIRDCLADLYGAGAVEG